MKQMLLLLVLVPALALTAWSAGPGDGPANGGKAPLDLPAGGLASDEDDEDAPETINFYGSEYEGSAFFWCFHAFNF